jgi:putative addiction module component (TIGR02574 family)
MRQEKVMSIHAEFQQYSITEKVQVVQELWDQIAASPEQLPIPAWHRAELEKREHEHTLSPDPGEDWDIVKARLREAL